MTIVFAIDLEYNKYIQGGDLHQGERAMLTQKTYRCLMRDFIRDNWYFILVVANDLHEAERKANMESREWFDVCVKVVEL